MKLLAKRAARRFHYYRSKWWWSHFRHLGTLIDLFVLDTQPGKSHNEFYICVYHREYDTPEFHYFAATIIQSLDLIARHDPRRYKTVVSNIKIISWHPHYRLLGAYYRLPRVCIMNYKNAPKERADGDDNGDTTNTSREPTLVEVVGLAGVLIHEATHGRICSFFVPYDKNREAIEKLCHEEERRFWCRLYNRGVYPSKEAIRHYYEYRRSQTVPAQDA